MEEHPSPVATALCITLLKTPKFQYYGIKIFNINLVVMFLMFAC